MTLVQTSKEYINGKWQKVEFHQTKSGRIVVVVPSAARKKSRHAAALGKLGGRSKSEKKASAARINGTKGGRPSKSTITRS